jgi:hypothetical protein
MASRYHFVTDMTLSSSPDAVEATLEDVGTWPAWWRWVRQAEQVNSLPPGAVGARYRHRIRTPLAYGLSYVIEVVSAHPGLIEVSVSGDLVGTGLFTYETTRSGETALSFSWQVETTKWWMKVARPLAGPVFAWAHDLLMTDFVQGLAQASGGTVVSVAHERLRPHDPNFHRT